MRSPFDKPFGLRSPFGPQSGVNPYALVPSGYLAEWRFTEGSGNTVADTTGTYNINLTTPTSPNATWNGKTIDLAAGLIQTPSINSVRTIAYLHKTTRGNAAGFELSGEGGLATDGALGNYLAASSTWYGGHNAHNMFRRTDGTGARENNRAGWRLVICVQGAASNGIWGFGGRHSNTVNRVANFSIAYAAVWDRALDATERADLYTAARLIAKSKGVYIDYRDCPTQADAMLLWGQSNALGNASISDLSAGNQAREFTKTYIQAALMNTQVYPSALLDLGVNQRPTNANLLFGPEIGVAIQREDNPTGRDLYISKTATGSTWLDWSGNGVSTSGNTWSDQEFFTTNGFYTALQFWYDMQGNAMESGIGLELKALCFMQGEQDATNAGPAGRYETNLGTFYTAVKDYTGYSSLPIVLGKIPTGDVSMTESTTVRAAQAAFVAANSGFATLIDTDGYTLETDNVHFDADGQLALGAAFYDAIF